VTDEGGAPGVVLALSTAPDAATAERIARALVDERLIACMNVVPGLTSIYRWGGEVRRDSEVLMLMKTRPGRVDALRARISELHPYEVPELLVAPVVDGLAPYCRWVRDETAGDDE
jgi:periplasmic divalent cation tolerance protein